MYMHRKYVVVFLSAIDYFHKQEPKSLNMQLPDCNGAVL